MIAILVLSSELNRHPIKIALAIFASTSLARLDCGVPLALACSPRGNSIIDMAASLIR
ncbi:hypothetical protein [Croceicoccus hydrothermalis]|uniref:hypothetical protein n=1 Tax=Croceicoccus hydrothermalis TaxID=2867964 RepID=UPI001EFC1E5C|nr:hypothetical protein [Croceicoccus hydrothermalis]